jgi:hypothetical protein
MVNEPEIERKKEKKNTTATGDTQGSRTEAKSRAGK